MHKIVLTMLQMGPRIIFGLTHLWINRTVGASSRSRQTYLKTAIRELWIWLHKLFWPVRLATVCLCARLECGW